MGLLDRLAAMLGYVPPIEVHELGPAALTPSGSARLAAIGAGLRVATVPAQGGHVVRVTEVPGAPAGLVGEPADLFRMRGLLIDWDQRWKVVASLRLDAEDTPNPNGRKYLADRLLASGRPQFFLAAAPAAGLAARVLAVPNVVSALFRDNTITVERLASADWGPIDAGVDAAIREHLLLCGEPLPPVEATPRDGLIAEVEAHIAAKVAPKVHADGGDITLVDVRDGVVLVELSGACRTCPASAVTLRFMVENELKQAFPGKVTRVESLSV
jgi:Fe-S cluster biogenesis protein NfuA